MKCHSSSWPSSFCDLGNGLIDVIFAKGFLAKVNKLTDFPGRLCFLLTASRRTLGSGR